MGKINLNNLLGNHYIGSVENYNKRMENLNLLYEEFYKNNPYMKIIETIRTTAINQNTNEKFTSYISAREIFYNENKEVLDEYYSSSKTIDTLMIKKNDVFQEDFIIEYDKILLQQITLYRDQIVESYNLNIIETDIKDINSVILLRNYNVLLSSMFIIEPALWVKIILNDLSFYKKEDKNEVVNLLNPLKFDVINKTHNDYIKIYGYNSASDEYVIFDYKNTFENSKNTFNIENHMGKKCGVTKKPNTNELILKEDFSIKGLINLIYFLIAIDKKNTITKDLRVEIEKRIKTSIISKGKHKPYSKSDIDSSESKEFIPKKLNKNIILLFYYLDKYLQIFKHDRRENNEINITRISEYFGNYISPKHKGLSKSNVKKSLEKMRVKYPSQMAVLKGLDLKPNQIQNLLTNSIPDIEKFIKKI